MEHAPSVGLKPDFPFFVQSAGTLRCVPIGVWLGCDSRSSGESTARESQAKRLSKVTDKAYFVRRLRARAGTVVAPGLRFCFSGPGNGLVRFASYRVFGGSTAAGVARVPALRDHATGRFREPALRVEPGPPLS